MREHYAVYINYGKGGLEAVAHPLTDTREQVVRDIASGQHDNFLVYAVLRIAIGEPCEDVTEDVLDDAWELARDLSCPTAPYIMDALEAYRKRKRQQAEAERGLVREAVNG